MRAHMYTCINAHMNLCIDACLHIYMYTYIHVSVPISLCMSVVFFRPCACVLREKVYVADYVCVRVVGGGSQRG